MEFLTLCEKQEYSKKDCQEFQEALEFAKIILGPKTRLSGESYYTHNVNVAKILMENKSEPEIIITAILHGLLKDVNKEIIQKRFGKEVLGLLEGATELGMLKVKHGKLDPSVLRKIMLTTLKDPRVVLVKLANKLENMKTIHVFSQKEQERLAEEVLDFYAPLAYRLGVERFKIQLEDVAFRILNPKKYKEIATFLKETEEEREHNINGIISKIKGITKDKVNLINIKGRSKQIYSIYKKLKRTGASVQLHKQMDLLGIRILAKNVGDCYTVLGLLLETFTAREGRLKDYIANPKSNFYRSIHVGLELPHGKVVEVQIRTQEMDEFADEGVAAHWRYKSLKSDELFEKKISWLRNVLDLQKTNELIESVKVDLFGDKIQCYTPKGDVKELPVDATLLDFAYLVHEQIGNHCIGGRVNGKFVPLKHKLHNEDVIEVLINKKQRPRRGWIRIVTSSKARQKIRKSLKEFEKLPAIYFRTFKPEITEELGILVKSEVYPNATCILAKCCKPIPGDEILGIVTKRKIISTHRTDCKLAEKESNRWVSVEWKNEYNQKIQFSVVADERSGLLADLLNTIVRAQFEVKEAKAKLVGSGQAECSFLVIPKDLDHVKELIKRIFKLRGVKKVYFG
ncbi:hypothetical protein COV12_04215 [Candidatus Woesearchaeota archaeon CG10_big_fil_rev_8_21_14_0_10_32_24]|nr:MAG: hypothetical protein COV12_04215 [Candidatus Woesearchaeota archaeon CG10_big_fil_rev_8_21_14_0_10_32_24]